MTKITLTAEQEDQVVVDTLQDLHYNLTPDKDFGEVPELLKSIEHVLSHFMTSGAYRKWKTVVDNRTTV